MTKFRRETFDRNEKIEKLDSVIMIWKDITHSVKTKDLIAIYL